MIQPSDSPWASPIVMVRKKDGTHRFCMDYHSLNEVTKADTYPLPRVDDQLSRARFFTTLDLASGFWQIRVAPGSRKKTAFVVPQGLFKFRVMPLHMLTRKNMTFHWDEDCQCSFATLKKCLCLTTAPVHVLAYPSLDKPFILETDAHASILGIGAVLSQVQGDGQCHPVAYANRSFTAPKCNYSITELETLAVVWAIGHYHSYIYGQDVTVYTDHSAVKAILNAFHPSGKHA